jgi:charged multivesicular body protein 4
MGWFGKKSKAATTSKSMTPASNPQQTVATLRVAIDQQEKRENHIQSKVDALVSTAKSKMVAGDKKGALFAMKQKKMYEAEMDKINNVKMTLETQCMNLESAVQNKDTFLVMKTGTGAMQKIRKDMDIDKVDEMMDDIKEEMEAANEIGNAIGQSLDVMTVDEDELLAELQGLSEKDTNTESRYDMPAVPTSRLSSQKQASRQKEEADALKELQAMMA